MLLFLVYTTNWDAVIHNRLKRTPRFKTLLRADIILPSIDPPGEASLINAFHSSRACHDYAFVFCDDATIAEVKASTL